MKKTIPMILTLLLMFSGCAIKKDRAMEPVTFYYLRDHSAEENHQVFFSEGAIGAETRESAGHRQDLSYLLALYLQGPMDDSLLPAFPIGSKLSVISHRDGELTVYLYTMASSANEMDLTISCACLAKTCMDLADADIVTIEAYDPNNNLLFARSFSKENLILEDIYAQSIPDTEPAQ